MFFSIICENLAVISMWGGDWYEFYIVEKENDPTAVVFGDNQDNDAVQMPPS